MMDQIIERRTARPAREAKMTVMVVEDDPDSRAALELAVLGLGHACVVACDGAEAWEMHQAAHADVIVADWRMPNMDGIALCARVRSHEPPSPYTYFVFITARDKKADFLAGMHAGADDYISKPIDADKLEARLAVAFRAVQLQRERVRATSALRRKSDRNFRAARTDPLTAISNRLELTEDLDLLASRANEHPYAAALCDIDQFKAYNDHYGHLAGDDVLRRVSSAIQVGLRRGDGFYRYGGEEFLAILPGQTLSDAAMGMERIRRSVEALGIVHAPRTLERVVTLSVGIAELRTEATGWIQDWLRRADGALYAAKRQGRNCVVIERGSSHVPWGASPKSRGT